LIGLDNILSSSGYKLVEKKLFLFCVFFFQVKEDINKQKVQIGGPDGKVGSIILSSGRRREFNFQRGRICLYLIILKAE
jgi:hypothetical protein